MSTLKLADYQDKYQHIKFRREDGILEMTLHTKGGSLRWGRKAHGELVDAFLDIGRDRENHVVIMTGTGPEFSGPAPDATANMSSHAMSPQEWGELGWEAKHLLTNLLLIDVPMIAAVNGPAVRHAELPILCDIVLPLRMRASRTARISSTDSCPVTACMWRFPPSWGSTARATSC